jgi:hypothetical protein
MCVSILVDESWLLSGESSERVRRVEPVAERESQHEQWRRQSDPVPRRVSDISKRADNVGR